MAELAASFDGAAELYERARPSYPDAAIDWLLPADARVVLDLGAGTGKLTRAIVDRRLECFAVDPSARMLEQLRMAVPRAHAIQGTGESIPLHDAAVDAVVVAQAWHWMDPVPATREVARVLRPAGTLGLVWNMRDERVDWVARLGEIIHDGPSSELMDDPPRLGSPFGPTEQTVIDWVHELSRREVFDLIASRSHFITRTEPEQRVIVDNVTRLLDTLPDMAGRDLLPLPYRTFCFRARLA